MSTLGIDGLASGLDTTTIINQLMQLERQPAVRMESRISANTAAINSLNALHAAFEGIAAGASPLEASTGFTTVKATSSHSSVAATASAGSALGSITFTVDQLAATHRTVSAGQTADKADTVAVAGTTFTITVDGTDFDIDTGDGSLQALVDNINGTADLGVSATAVSTGSGWKLQLASDTSGAGGVFTVDPGDGILTGISSAFAGSMPVLTQGQDAEITVGTGPGAYTVTAASNTFNDVVEGLSFSVSEADPTREVTVTTRADADAVVAKVRTFVSTINSTLKTLREATDSGSDGTKGSLSNDPAMRNLRNSLMNAITYGVAGSSYGSAGLIGVESTRDGKLEFDEGAFRAALAEDPEAVIAIFTSDDPDHPGIAQRVQAVATSATTAKTGVLDTSISSLDSRNQTLQDSITRLDVRLELRRQTLQRQFTALEVALSSMQAQGDWLTSQLPALQANAPGNNS